MQTTESASENRDTGVVFLESNIVFYPVTQEIFENRIPEGHVVALVGTQVEWQKWLEEYMPKYTIQDKVFEYYNLELFKNNYLLIYQGDLRQYGHNTTGVEHIYIEDDDEEETYKLVTTVRGNSMQGRISIDSPLGKAILGHKVGDRVYVKVNDRVGYYCEIRHIEKTVDDGSDELRGF